MTTIYVAGPMTGYPESNYPAFRLAGEQLRAAGFSVLNPVDAERFNPAPGVPQAWDWYMRYALRGLLKADGLALLSGWEASRCATLEVHVAKALRLPVMRLDSWTSPAIGHRTITHQTAQE